MPPPETVVRLIPPMEVSPECLGLDFAVSVGGFDYRLSLPIKDNLPNSARFFAPHSASDELRGQPWDWRSPWANDQRMTHDSVVLGVAIHRVVLSGGPTGTTPAEVGRAASTHGHAVNTWYLNVYSWLELWTAQSLSGDQWPQTGARTEGRGQTTDGHDYEWGSNWHHWSGDGSDGPIATPDMLEAAIRMGNRGIRPSLPWELIRRARGAGDTRQQVINAATSAEVAIERRLNQALSSQSLLADQIDSLTKPLTGIVEKLRVMETFEVGSSSLVKQVGHRIAGPRNAAAHGGHFPTADEVKNSIRTAVAVLELYDPLPQPTDTPAT